MKIDLIIEEISNADVFGNFVGSTNFVEHLTLVTYHVQRIQTEHQVKVVGLCLLQHLLFKNTNKNDKNQNFNLHAPSQFNLQTATNSWILLESTDLSLYLIK